MIAVSQFREARPKVYIEYGFGQAMDIDGGQGMHMDMGMDKYKLVIYDNDNISSVYISLIINSYCSS